MPAKSAHEPQNQASFMRLHYENKTIFVERLEKQPNKKWHTIKSQTKSKWAIIIWELVAYWTGPNRRVIAKLCAGNVNLVFSRSFFYFFLSILIQSKGVNRTVFIHFTVFSYAFSKVVCVSETHWVWIPFSMKFSFAL